MAKFFIDRPIFAWVIALFIMVLGGRCHNAAAHLAISPGCTAFDRYQCVLPGRFCANAGGQRSFRDRA